MLEHAFEFIIENYCVTFFTRMNNMAREGNPRLILF